MTQLADAQDLADLKGAVAELCHDAGDLEPARAMEESKTDHDAPLWAKLGDQMGLSGVGLPDEVGGLGGLAEIVTVMECLGESLAPVPFWSSTVLAGQILSALDPRPDDLLVELCEGALFAAVIVDRDGRWLPEQVTAQAHPDGSGWKISGLVHFVAGASSARHLVVAARTPAGTDLFLVDPEDEHVLVTAARSLDFSRPLSSVAMDGVVARRLSDGGTGAAATTAGVDVALVALAAEQAAGAKRCLAMTVDYVKLRHQFSRPIGSFQAIKHRLVDMLALVEFASSAVDRAVASPADRSSLAEAASVAAVWCADAYREVCADTIQLHGGIGFTWEHDAHLFFRRAHADAVMLGDAAFHRERIAALLSW